MYDACVPIDQMNEWEREMHGLLFEMNEAANFDNFYFLIIISLSFWFSHYYYYHYYKRYFLLLD